MKKIFLCLVISMSLFASSIIQMYRDDGIKSVERYLNKQLQSKTYWKKYLRDKDVKFGYYENLSSLLVIDKASKEMDIYKNSKEGVEFIKSQTVIVGRAGDKVKEGDLKTPLGVYKIVKKFHPNSSFYGPFAYALSYPNTFDRLRGKGGHGIWIHGSPLDGSPRNPQSKGCIVLPNDKIKKLDKLINPKSTISLVYENKIRKTNINEMSLILSQLFTWKNFWKNNETSKYLNFYSKNFIRFDGMRKKSFARMKKIIFDRDEKKSIIFKNINISPLPNIKGEKLFKIAFYEIYSTRKHKYKGNKELYVRLKNDKILILAEK
ncbi:MAG: L,D-transpeptidase family protein [Epsilonproteobacteria bacterium]|nr:L,D-transpeptidase family protein [Campylobacterota bacterium]